MASMSTVASCLKKRIECAIMMKIAEAADEFEA
jgi:hypothetical protein